jgi:hypothetical protein
MMPRTTATAVSLVRTVEQDGDIEVILAPFIETANSLVTEKCTGGSLTDERLELIERWLSAHFYSLSPDGKMTLSETVGPITETFFGKIGFALSLTFYGQQAMILDTTGSLAAWNAQVISGKTQQASVVWGGTARPWAY